LSETLRELANLVAGAMVLGQFVGDARSSAWPVLAGVVLWFFFVGVAVVLKGDN
jgi:hypothetical protein